MTPITTGNIIEEANDIYNLEGFIELGKKYPHRVRLSISINIDGSNRPLNTDNEILGIEEGAVLIVENGITTKETILKY
ncbi:MAG: hypothetical protein GY928_31955 [Colwellia sp.]|nr:hypothetical protein [Colwellia sp.]